MELHQAQGERVICPEVCCGAGVRRRTGHSVTTRRTPMACTTRGPARVLLTDQHDSTTDPIRSFCAPGHMRPWRSGVDIISVRRAVRR